MTTSPSPEQSASAILGIFKSQNYYAGDPFEITYIKTQFIENHGSAGDYAAGLMYAEDNGWLEVTPTRDRQQRDMLTYGCRTWSYRSPGSRIGGRSTVDAPRRKGATPPRFS